MKNGEGTRKRLKIVSFFNAISVVCGQWRVVMECKTELLDQLWLLYREFCFTWQERESLESTWIRPLEVRDGNAVSILWSFMFVFEAQYTGVLWRLLVQNKRIIVVRELINGVDCLGDQTLSNYNKVHLSCHWCIMGLWIIKAIRFMTLIIGGQEICVWIYLYICPIHMDFWNENDLAYYGAGTLQSYFYLALWSIYQLII